MAISLKENYLKSIYLDYADEYQIFIIMRNKITYLLIPKIRNYHPIHD